MDWPDPVAELPQVIATLKNLGARSIVEIGCGRGRNAEPLARNFLKVYLVEVEKNMGLVEGWIRSHRFANCKAREFSAFAKEKVKLDSCLCCFVLHTIPSHALRKRLIRTIKSKLKSNGLLAIIAPSHDSKYSKNATKRVPRYADGIVRLYEDGTFSFYKNYEFPELLQLFKHTGLEVLERIPGHHRYIVVAHQLNDN